MAGAGADFVKKGRLPRITGELLSFEKVIVCTIIIVNHYFFLILTNNNFLRNERGYTSILYKSRDKFYTIIF